MSVSVPPVTLSDLDEPIFKVPAGINDDMYQVLSVPTNETLTTRQVDGQGVFDALMSSVNEHLKVEYDKGRITGAEYTRTYIALAQAAMTNAVQYALTKDQSFWQAQNAQIAAVTARVGLENARLKHVHQTPAEIDLIQKQAAAADAQRTLTLKQVDVATAQITLVGAQANQVGVENNRITAQTAQITAQTAQIAIENSRINAQTTQINAQTAQVTAQTNQIPVQTSQIQAQTALLTAQATTVPIQNAQIQAQTAQVTAQTAQIEAQTLLVTQQRLVATEQVQATIAQTALIREQSEVQRAQTLNTRLDGTTITGVLGKQRDLYNQQIEAYQRDAEVKIAKLFSDAWITQKSIDEGLVAPGQFQNETINNVLQVAKNKAGLG
jgi:hypothetical protein